MSGSRTPLPAAVSAVTPLDGKAIDGTRRPRPRRTGPPAAKPYTSTAWRCPSCGWRHQTASEGDVRIALGHANNCLRFRTATRVPAWRQALTDAQCRAYQAEYRRLIREGRADEITPRIKGGFSEYNRRGNNRRNALDRGINLSERASDWSPVPEPVAMVTATERAALLRELPSPAERKRIREAAGLEPVEVAQMVGVSRWAASEWERGISTPRGLNLRTYVGVLRRLSRTA